MKKTILIYNNIAEARLEANIKLGWTFDVVLIKTDVDTFFVTKNRFGTAGKYISYDDVKKILLDAEPELKPCPLCNSEVSYLYTPESWFNCIKCLNCGIKMVETGITKAELFIRWNTRK